ncbi:MAG: prolipoprotein diacylglyceryl transferase family protein [Pseudomonadota bacterium]
MPPLYGVLVALGMACGVGVGWILAPRTGLSRKAFSDVAFAALVAGLLGARLLFVLVEWETFRDLCASGQDCWAAVKVWKGGLVYYGGLLSGLAGGLAWARFAGLPLADAAALFAVGQPLGHAVGRAGCLVRGCCYGQVHAGLPWALEDRHPTAIYEIIGEGLLFALTLGVFLRETRRDRPRLWRPLGVYLGSYAALRFLVECFRGDPQRGFLVGLDTPGLAGALGLPPDAPLLLSVSQGLSLLVLAGVVLAVFLRRGTPTGQ